MEVHEIIKFKMQNKIIFAALLITLGVLFRTVWHLGPNVEFITSACLLSGSYLGRKWAILVPVFIMLTSDLIIGNTNIFIFTWSAYIVVGILGYWGLKNKNARLPDGQEKLKITKIIKATGLGIIASLWFYLWTNFGVWLLDSWGMYPRTITGLVDAYILGLPFLKYNLMGNLVFVPVSFSLVEIVKSIRLDTNYLFKKIEKILS